MISEKDWFYTTPRFENELPIGTRVRVVKKGELKPVYEVGREGSVVGYRFAKTAVWPTGWHYIQFDDDPQPINSAMPYVHRDYLEVIE